MGDVVDECPHGMGPFAKPHQRKAEQNRKQQHLQDFTLCKRPDHGVRNDVQEKVY